MEDGGLLDAVSWENSTEPPTEKGLVEGNGCNRKSYHGRENLDLKKGKNTI